MCLLHHKACNPPAVLVCMARSLALSHAELGTARARYRDHADSLLSQKLCKPLDCGILHLDCLILHMVTHTSCNASVRKADTQVHRLIIKHPAGMARNTRRFQVTDIISCLWAPSPLNDFRSLGRRQVTVSQTGAFAKAFDVFPFHLSCLEHHRTLHQLI